MNAFDPSDWLDRFEAAGGGWYICDGRPVWCYVRGSENAVTRLVFETYHRGRSDAIDAEIMSRKAVKEPRPS